MYANKLKGKKKKRWACKGIIHGGVCIDDGFFQTSFSVHFLDHLEMFAPSFHQMFGWNGAGSGAAAGSGNTGILSPPPPPPPPLPTGPSTFVPFSFPGTPGFSRPTSFGTESQLPLQTQAHAHAHAQQPPLPPSMFPMSEELPLFVPTGMDTIPFFASEINQIVERFNRLFTTKPWALVLIEPMSVMYMAFQAPDPAAMSTCFKFHPVFATCLTNSEMERFVASFQSVQRRIRQVGVYGVLETTDPEGNILSRFVNMPTLPKDCTSTLMSLTLNSFHRVFHLNLTEIESQIVFACTSVEGYRAMFLPVFLLMCNTPGMIDRFPEIRRVFMKELVVRNLATPFLPTIPSQPSPPTGKPLPAIQEVDGEDSPVSSPAPAAPTAPTASAAPAAPVASAAPAAPVALEKVEKPKKKAATGTVVTFASVVTSVEKPETNDREPVLESVPTQVAKPGPTPAAGAGAGSGSGSGSKPAPVSKSGSKSKSGSGSKFEKKKKPRAFDRTVAKELVEYYMPHISKPKASAVPAGGDIEDVPDLTDEQCDMMRLWMSKAATYAGRFFDAIYELELDLPIEATDFGGDEDLCDTFKEEHESSQAIICSLEAVISAETNDNVFTEGSSVANRILRCSKLESSKFRAPFKIPIHEWTVSANKLLGSYNRLGYPLNSGLAPVVLD